MPDQSSRKKFLFDRLIKGKLSKDEAEELVQWLGADEQDAEAAGLIAKQLNQAEITLEEIDPAIVSKLEARLPFILQTHKKKQTPIVSLLTQKWMRYAAAIILFAIVGYSVFILVSPGTKDSPQVSTAQFVPAEQITPGKTGAILTLVDGSQVMIDSVKNGFVTMQNGTKVLLQNGQLIYDAAQSSGSDVGYNIVSTPKGRQIQLSLPDGSQVWLNAASSIRYPTVFSSKERKVEIKGEAYFEVARNERAPFFVKINELKEVEVLGTHFNINSYENEESINTTLLEGSVRIKSSNNNIVLKPGQQAQSSNRESIKVVNDVDIEKVMAWKNGVFNFQDASLQEVMRQLERWYDIEVTYEKNIPQLEFFGKMGKDLNLATVLRGLEKSNVHFRMEAGRKLVVLP